ncbi:MAG: hypothetical protein ACFFB0_14760 [Promethearchaeota archaeon]
MSLHEILEIKKHQIIKPINILNEFQKNKDKQIALTSGSNNFDETIGGGFYSGRTYLIFGATKTGKTQLCHQLCIQAYKLFSKKLKKREISQIFYFDTENTFRPERIKDLSSSSNLEYEKVLKSIIVSTIMSNSALQFAVKDLVQILNKNQSSVLIIDTINNYYRSDFSNNNITFTKTKDVFLKILESIHTLAKTHNLITILTAQVSSNFAENAIIREIPVGNQFLNHFFSDYLYLSYKDEKKIYVQMINSLKYPNKKLIFTITKSGIQDS